MHYICKRCVVLVLIVLPSIAFSQGDSSYATCRNSCCFKDPSPSGIMISFVHQKKQFMLSYRYMNMGMAGMLDQSSQVSDDQLFQKNYSMSSSSMNMSMHMLMAMYGLTDRLTLMGMFNYNVSTMNMTMLSQNSMMNMPGMNMGTNMTMNMTMKSSGISDTKISALYSLIDKTKHHLLVAAGISMPTGSIQLTGKQDMYVNERLPYAMQNGSGTWDLLPVVNYLHYKNKITWCTQMSAVVRTGYNSVGYKLGNEVTFNHWLAYQWVNWLSTSYRLQGTYTGSVQGYDPSLWMYTEPSANSKNYGGQSASAYLGANVYLPVIASKISVEYGIPFYQNFNGLQMGRKSLIYGSWTFVF